MSFNQDVREETSGSLPVKINNLSKTYFIYDKPQDRLKQSIFRSRKYFHEFDALKDITLDIEKGSSIGIVGRNGSGKSTLLQLICGTLSQTAGDIEVSGRISALLELGAGFNPDFTGKENIFLNAAILGLSNDEVKDKYDSIVDFADIGGHIHQPVKTYSSGMYVRLAFAVAVATDPDILVVDEALAVGDLAFQRKCFSRISQMQKGGTTILFVSHSINTITEICDRVVLLDGGELILDGDPKEVLSYYRKLMFASEDKASAIRNELKNLGTVTEKGSEEFFDSSMKPESTVEYESRGAEISNPKISTLDGKDANFLISGNKYQYSYEVTFSEDAHDVWFGMTIKTKEGVNLGGSVTHTEHNAIPEIRSGSTIKVEFIFTCLLLSGVYFTNAGCSGVRGGERVHLHRIMDACMFRVEADESTKATGKVDLHIESEVSV